MTYEQLKQLKPEAFKTRCGLQIETFNQMIEILNPHLDRRGKSPRTLPDDETRSIPVSEYR